MKGKYYIETMGCPKNFNDSEYAAGVLDGAGYEEAASITDADFVIVNTCGFIEDAKVESINKTFEAYSLLKPGAKLIMTGCLSQRYGEELKKEMPEVSCFVGVNDYNRLPEIFENMEEGVFLGACNIDYLEKTIRKYRKNPYTSTIKIAEGCDNKCAYCIIPSIRGRYRSKKMEDILLEAEELAAAGCKELILIAQDVTYYGKDLYQEYMLPKLLRELVKVQGIQWIRLMYCYDVRITDELIDVMAKEEKICKYIDIPIQHSSDKVLREMKRGITRKGTLEVIRKLRDAIPDIAIRTSLIVGFPGETEEDFRDLLDFVEEVKFARLGVFKYSREEGTPAGAREDQIDDEIKEQRLDIIMRTQMDISLKNNEALIGKTLDVIVDREEEDSYIGRTKQDAPEIDNEVIFQSHRNLKPGDIVKVRITDAFDYDLVGMDVERVNS